MHKTKRANHEHENNDTTLLVVLQLNILTADHLSYSAQSYWCASSDQ